MPNVVPIKNKTPGPMLTTFLGDKRNINYSLIWSRRIINAMEMHGVINFFF